MQTSYHHSADYIPPQCRRLHITIVQTATYHHSADSYISPQCRQLHIITVQTVTYHHSIDYISPQCRQLHITTVETVTYHHRGDSCISPQCRLSSVTSTLAAISKRGCVTVSLSVCTPPPPLPPVSLVLMTHFTL